VGRRRAAAKVYSTCSGENDDFDLPVDSFEEIPADFAGNELSGPQPAMSASRVAWGGTHEE
jgi:hypothetical protein